MPTKFLKLSTFLKERKTMTIQENHILIGLGGTGGRVIRAFRKRIYNEFGKEDREKLPIGYVYVDADDKMMGANDAKWKIFGENIQIGKNSQLFLRGASLRAQLDRIDNYPNIKNWIGDRSIWDNIVENIAEDGAAGQRRRLGRFLFACKAQDFTAILQSQVQNIRSKYNKSEVTFHVVTGLAGGTGSGSIIDVIAQIRKQYPRNETGARFRILVYAFMPEELPQKSWDQGYYHANGYAALMELNALAVGRINLSDVTGQAETLDFKGNAIFDGCYLYSNINEKGIVVDNDEQLPNIVSDFLLQKIIIPAGSDATAQIRRAEANENLMDTFEYDENRPQKDLRVRSFRFLGFGVKRIEIPEEEIIEYLTYNLTRQVLLQFKYNNWSDDLGFQNTPQNIDAVSYVTDKDKLSSWLLSDEHLVQSLPILNQDKIQNWKTIQEDWSAEIVKLKAIVADSVGEESPLNKLSKFCEDRFDKGFRKNGVTEFYRLKTLSVKIIAKEIRINLEKTLFENWRSGKQSVSEISEIVEKLIEHLNTRLDKIDGEFVKLDENIKNNMTERSRIANEALKVGIFGKYILKKESKILDSFGALSQQLYINRTYKIAWGFGKTLLSATINELLELSGTLRGFSANLNDMIDSAEKLINVRCQDKPFGQDSLKESQVKYYKVENVKLFKERIIRDKKIQSEQASKIRGILVSKIGTDLTFSKMYEKISSDILLDTLENNCQEYTITVHNEVFTDKKQKIIGVNIIEKLYEEYNNNPDGLGNFVRGIVEYSGLFLNFNTTELSSSLKNNANPKLGTNIRILTVIIRIPLTSDKKEFVEKLKNAFTNAIDGDNNIVFDEHNSEKQNEITIISLANGFPIRVVAEAKVLKEKYDAAIKNIDESEARLVLHLEGDGTNYPSLFSLSREEKERQKKQLLEENLPNVLLAYAMGTIQLQDKGDGSGKSIYGVATKDEYGMAAGLIVLGLKFIEIENTLDQDIALTLSNEVALKLSGEYFNNGKRIELKDKIIGHINNVVLSECNQNTNNSTYLLFQKAAGVAFKSLQIS